MLEHPVEYVDTVLYNPVKIQHWKSILLTCRTISRKDWRAITIIEEERTRRYRDGLENVKRDLGSRTLEMWKKVLEGSLTFEDYQEALDDALELSRVADEQLNSLDDRQQSDN